jgi:hypothetical protein
VRLDVPGGGVFVVTNEDPHGAAGLLNDLVARIH